MGTRAVIIVGKHKVALYKHWDGYPESIQPIIQAAFARLVKFGRVAETLGQDEPDLLLAEIFKCCDDLDSPGGYRLDTVKQLLDTDCKYQYKIVGTTVTYKGETNGTFSAIPMIEAKAKRTKMVRNGEGSFL